MAAKKASKKKEDLDALLQEATSLLGEKEISRKRKKGRSDLEFYRDSTTGLRKYKHKYRPREKKVTNTSLCSATEEEQIDGVSAYDAGHEMQSDDVNQTDNELQSTLLNCQEVLESFQSLENNWEKRMDSLNENWESSRELIFKSILLTQGSHMLGQLCAICAKGKCDVRCVECGGKKMCSECDALIHQDLLFHDREAFVDGFYRHIPPTVNVNEDGKLVQTRKYFFFNTFKVCPKCEQDDTLTVNPSGGSIIVVNQKGRFDFNNCTISCSGCGYKINSWSLEKTIEAGYWPGSPKDSTYLFDQNLFRQWDFLQKRIPGTSEVSFLKALGDFSQSKGRAPAITPTTFSRSFKEWKFCMYEVEIIKGLSWMVCPTCALDQHSCHVDGNMKLYRYQSSGVQKRSCYYGDTFIAPKADVDSHIKVVYAKVPRSTKSDKDSMCGESHWRAAQNTARKKAKLDETGLEIAGCRHGLSQWAVNMYQGEIYGYAHFIQTKKMYPAGVKFFWEDVVCKYWKWAGKVGGLKELNMKPALSVMHAKAHKWTCQVLWGGRWQVGSACSTGEEVEQINSYMSRCGNTTKYMLPEGRDEVLTEHAIAWNKRKICAMPAMLVKRFARVVEMCHASKKDCDNILTEYNLNSDKNLNIAKWKEEVIEQAKAEELVSTARQSSSERETLKCQIEMLSFSLARTTTAISKQADSSKQRTRLRKKLTSEKKTLQKLIDEYNKVNASTAEEPLTFEGVISGELLDNADNSSGTPIRLKSRIVDVFEIHARWVEEVDLLKKEMSNFVKHYTEVCIPSLKVKVKELEEAIKFQVEDGLERHDLSPSADEEKNKENEIDSIALVKYSYFGSEPAVLYGKLAFLKEGLFFCKEQVSRAIYSFTKVFDANCDGIADEDDEDDDNEGTHIDAESDSDVEDDDINIPATTMDDDHSQIIIPIHSWGAEGTVWTWQFPLHISQSTIDGRNGSNACSVIALLIAQGIHQVRCDLKPFQFLPKDWVSLICGCIKVGNALYDHSRASLPQRYLSAAEAAMVAGDCLNVSISEPLPVRVCDVHGQSTLKHHLFELCNVSTVSYALFIVNEKTVLFVGARNEFLIFVDSHVHGHHGAIIALGKPLYVDDFVGVVKEFLGIDSETFGNFVNISF